MRRQPPRHARRTYLLPALLIASLAAACIAGSSGAASANGLVGAYSFDAGAGTSVADNSGSANTGTLSGATWVAGKTGQALSFDGVNDWVTIADSASLDLSGAMTLEAWVKPSGGGWRTVALKERPGGLAYALYSSTSNGRPSAEIRTSRGYEMRGPAKLASGVWSHLATTYDGSTLRLYVNGAQVASQSATGGMVNSSGPLRIGGNAVWSEWFSGQIDDLRIYNRALTTAELQTDMNTPVGGAAAPPPPPPPPPPPADSEAPSAPSGLTGGGQSQTQITLSWNASSDNVGVTGYSRYQNGTLVSSATGTSFSFTGLACGTSYTLAVDAYDAAGNRSSRPSISASTLPCTTATAPVAAYSFDAGSGTSLTDNSGSGNTGSISGATWTTAGKSGGALAFDGVNDIVTVADKASLDLSTGMTLEAWIRPTANSIWRTIVTKETSGNLTYGLFSNSDSPQPSAIVSIGSSPIQDITRGPSELSMSDWTHLASTYDGAVLRLYVNGAQVSTTTVTGAMADSPGPLQIGGNNVWAEWFQGQIDDLRVYDRALTASQLQSDMNTPVSSPPAGDTETPSAPPGLAVSGQTQNALTLTWNAATDNVGVTGYNTYRNGAAAGSTASATRTYTYSGLICGTTYALAVDAVDAVGNRSSQASINGTTSACSAGDTQPPSPPTGLVVNGQTQTALTLSWNASTDNVGVTGYNAYRNSAATGSTASATRTYTYTGLTCGTAYALSVDAVDAVANRSAQATASGTTSACSPPPPPPPPPGSGTANVWVDTNGGSCARQGTAAAYSDAQACSSLQAAYNVAAAGDTVNIADGTYGGQSLASGSKAITFRAAGPGRPSFGHFVSAASNITVRGVLIEDRNELSGTCGNASWGVLNPCSSNQTYDNVIVDGLNTGDKHGIESPGDGFVFKNGEVRNILNMKGFEGGADDMLIENNGWYNIRVNNSDVHNECMFVNSGDRSIYRGNRFIGCPTMALFFTNWNGGPAYRDVLIENNVFGHTLDASGGWHASCAFKVGWGYNNQNTVIGWVVRYNTFETGPCIDGTPAGGDNGAGQWYGNLGGNACAAEWVYRYNVGQTCGGTGEVSVANAVNSRTSPNVAPFYANATASDFHLKAGAAAIDRGLPGTYPAFDKDGKARPVGTAADAGAYEFG